MHVPLSTYRLQFTPSFGFQDAAGCLEYLNALGISDIYASPIFKARKGSVHGYDIVDPNQLNSELGSIEELETLLQQLKARGMFWLQDIVPNHMAYDSENCMLMDVLEHGEHSAFFSFFDIEWDHPYENMKGRVLAPFLGKFYADALKDGEINLQFDENGLTINYYQLKFPLRIETYFHVFEHDLDNLEVTLKDSYSDFIRFLGDIQLLKTLTATDQGDHSSQNLQHAKKMLWNFYNQHAVIKEFIDKNVTCFNGIKGDLESYNALDWLILQQRYRLSFWKVAAEEINYRRFFTVNDLISVNVQHNHVFAYTHNLLFKLIDQKKIDGLRVDHIDGLYDPLTYLKRLREKAAGMYIIVEKILDYKEEMSSEWPIQGTTGYDFLHYVNGLFCMQDNGKAFNRIYYRFSGLYTSYDDLLFERKKLIIEKHMGGNIDSLAHFIKNISSRDMRGRDITLNGLRKALVEIMAYFPVYRTYINHESFSDSDKAYIKEAVQKAKQKNPGLYYELDFIERFLLPDYDGALPDEDRQQWISFVMNFQQYTGPLMAKGVEDTFFYNFNRLVSLNEVGGCPDTFGLTREAFHAYNQRMVQSFPHALNATATHDTKRGEDVRARINVLSELPAEWETHIREWSKINKGKKTKYKNEYFPDGNDEYFLYQTLIGTYPFANDGNFTERIKNYTIKFVREAKVHTAWIKPDTEYEKACIAFVEKILQPSEDNRFLSLFFSFQKKVAYYGIFNSLSQTILKITAPGVPDFYQGTELWDFSLVDPDNRRPVDFAKRKALLTDIQKRIKSDIPGLLSELLANPKDGTIKLFLIHTLLQARREQTALFQRGDYIPLSVAGRFKEHVIAFGRKRENRWALTIAPRFLTALIKEDEKPLGDAVWHDTCLAFPKSMPAEWEDAITKQSIRADDMLFVGKALTFFPVALLINKEKA